MQGSCLGESCNHVASEDSGRVLVKVVGSPGGGYPPLLISPRISGHRPNSRLHSFFSEVMEEREDTVILPSRNSSAGLACLRNLWYNSVCRGVSLKKGSWVSKKGWTTLRPSEDTLRVNFYSLHTPQLSSVPTTNHLLNLHRQIFRKDIRCPPYHAPGENRIKSRASKTAMQTTRIKGTTQRTKIDSFLVSNVRDPSALWQRYLYCGLSHGKRDPFKQSSFD